ncbi:hypothetical protein [Desulfosarcina widdelii]|nr:hypothetical protein [Desulfosarcina widdelii]
MAGEADVSGLAAGEAAAASGLGQGGFGGLGIGNPGSYGGQDTVGAPGATGGAGTTSGGEADVAGLAAAEAASKAAAKAAAGEALTDADISAMVTVTQDANLAKSLTAETLAQSYMSTSKASDVDKSELADNYLAALVARGDISESDISSSDTMAKIVSFVTDFALSKSVVPVAGQLASKIGLSPIVGNLASLVSTESFVVSESRQSFAQHQAAKALGLSTESTVATQAGGSSGGEQQTASKANAGPATTQPATSTTMAIKETAAVKPTLAERQDLGLIGTGRRGTILTGPEGLSDEHDPKLKRNTLLGG